MLNKISDSDSDSIEIPRNVISDTNFIAVPINDNSFPGKLL